MVETGVHGGIVAEPGEGCKRAVAAPAVGRVEAARASPDGTGARQNGILFHVPNVLGAYIQLWPVSTPQSRRE